MSDYAYQSLVYVKEKEEQAERSPIHAADEGSYCSAVMQEKNGSVLSVGVLAKSKLQKVGGS